MTQARFEYTPSHCARQRRENAQACYGFERTLRHCVRLRQCNAVKSATAAAERLSGPERGGRNRLDVVHESFARLQPKRAQAALKRCASSSAYSPSPRWRMTPARIVVAPATHRRAFADIRVSPSAVRAAPAIRGTDPSARKAVAAVHNRPIALRPRRPPRESVPAPQSVSTGITGATMTPTGMPAALKRANGSQARRRRRGARLERALEFVVQRRDADQRVAPGCRAPAARADRYRARSSRSW